MLIVGFLICYIIIDGRAPTDDYSAFNDVWDKPDGGMHKYLHRFLTSTDATFQHIAVWTIVQLLESGFLQPLINLLSFKDNEEVQCHAISTLRNLAASSEKNKKAIVKAGAVQSIKELVLEVPINVQSEMTACVAVLALSG